MKALCGKELAGGFHDPVTRAGSGIAIHDDVLSSCALLFFLYARPGMNVHSVVFQSLRVKHAAVKNNSNVAGRRRANAGRLWRSEEHTSELQSLMRISYAVFCLKKQTNNNYIHNIIAQSH